MSLENGANSITFFEICQIRSQLSSHVRSRISRFCASLTIKIFFITCCTSVRVPQFFDLFFCGKRSRFELFWCISNVLVSFKLFVVTYIPSFYSLKTYNSQTHFNQSTKLSFSDRVFLPTDLHNRIFFQHFPSNIGPSY